MSPVLLIPVKALADVKQRLAPLLAPDERRQLARTMLEGVLAQGAAVASPLRRIIVTSDEWAAELARGLGYEVMMEEEQHSESASVDRASGILAAEGTEAVLRLPLDLPLLSAMDIEAVLSAAGKAPCTVLVPSRDGSGTNALYRAPPAVFSSRFGANSFFATRAVGGPCRRRLLRGKLAVPGPRYR